MRRMGRQTAQERVLKLAKKTGEKDGYMKTKNQNRNEPVGKPAETG
jgi:hypothetical protein